MTRRVAVALACLVAFAVGFLLRTPLDRAVLDGRLACDATTQTCTTQPTERH